jgi:hypothetical protein
MCYHGIIKYSLGKIIRNNSGKIFLFSSGHLFVGTLCDRVSKIKRYVNSFLLLLCVLFSYLGLFGYLQLIIELHPRPSFLTKTQNYPVLLVVVPAERGEEFCIVEAKN